MQMTTIVQQLQEHRTKGSLSVRVEDSSLDSFNLFPGIKLLSWAITWIYGSIWYGNLPEVMQYNFPRKKNSHVMRLTAFYGRRSMTQWQAGCGTYQAHVCISSPMTSSGPSYQWDTYALPTTNTEGSSHHGRLPCYLFFIPPLWCTQSWFHGSVCISLAPEVCFADCMASQKWPPTLGSTQLVIGIVVVPCSGLVPIYEILEFILLPNSKSRAITRVAWIWLLWEYIHNRNWQAHKSGGSPTLFQRVKYWPGCASSVTLWVR